MAKHEFGMMHTAPEAGKRYDAYEPQRYDCISIDDTYIEKLDVHLSDIDLYWHTVDVAGKGLAYCGVTLIPPASIPAFLSAIENNAPFSELRKLMERAKNENKWVIHFGL